MVIRIPHILSDDDLKAVRTLLEQASFRDGRLSAGKQAQTVKHNQEVQAQDDRIAALNQIVMQRLTTHPEYLTAVLPHRVAEPFYVRYSEGMEYGEHTDDPVMGTDNPYRSDIAITIFLNAPEEYVGGELMVNTQSAAQTQALKYPAGDAVLYPASTMHRVATVTQGVRLVAVTWAQSLVADVRHRELLYQLVRVRDCLLDKDSASSEARQICSVYSNLVRLWSTV